MLPSNRQRRASFLNPKNIGAPVVTPIPAALGGAQGEVGASPYFSLRVDTTNAGITTPTKIVLFDSSQGYQLSEGYAMPLLVGIEGLTDNYQSLLNDMAHIGSYVDICKMTVSDKVKAGIQFARSLEIYEKVRGQRPVLVKTIYPEMGIHEGQYQENINTFPVELTLTNRHALVYTQEPGIIVTFGFYQKAELGRKR